MSVSGEHRLRWRWVLLGLALLLPGADCFFRDRLHIAEGSAPTEFADLPGGLGLTFWIGGTDPTPPFRLLIRNGQISQVEQLPLPKYSANSGGMKSFDSWMPQSVADLTISPSGPFLQSPDGTLIAAAAKNLSGERVLVIFDSQTHEIRGRARPTAEEGGFGAIAWSPDSRYVAATLGKAQTCYCMGEIAGIVAGHPSSLLSGSLHVYDIRGEMVAAQELKSRSRWSTHLVWTK